MKPQNPADLMERAELVNKLIEKGYGELVKALLEGDSRVYTKRGRLNKSGACRVLNLKSKELEDALVECRQIIEG